MNVTQKIKTLIPRLKDSDAETREQAVLELSQIGSEEAAELLLSYLNADVRENDQDVREAVIYALGQIKAEKAVSSLVGYLEDSSLDVRWVTVEALGEIGSQEAIPALIKCLEKEQVWNVRASSVKALAKLNPETEAIGIMVDILRHHDENIFVRQEAAYGLSQIGFSLETVVKVNQLLPQLNWQELLNNFKKIAQTVSNRRQRINQAWEVLCDLAGLPPESMRLLVAEMSPETEKGDDEPKKIKEELYELANELMEQLPKDLVSNS